MQEALNPFSLEVRGCPGKSMAYMNISLAMANTLFYFEFEVNRGEEGNIVSLRQLLSYVAMSSRLLMAVLT